MHFPNCSIIFGLHETCLNPKLLAFFFCTVIISLFFFFFNFELQAPFSPSFGWLVFFLFPFYIVLSVKPPLQPSIGTPEPWVHSVFYFRGFEVRSRAYPMGPAPSVRFASWCVHAWSALSNRTNIEAMCTHHEANRTEGSGHWTYLGSIPIGRTLLRLRWYNFM